MRILFLTTAHNSLSQRLQVELTNRGHRVAIHLATGDEVMTHARRRIDQTSLSRRC